MYNSVSSSGTFSNKLFKIKATLMLPNEFPLLVGFTVYEITIILKDVKRILKPDDFVFCLYCNERIHIQAELKEGTEIKDFVVSKRRIFSNSIRFLILFPDLKDIHYMNTKMIFYFSPELLSSSFDLKY